ncbi:hypothetical protein [Aquisalibacillus elongatus]|uniref:Uncharacterized protein n=1 Tax=Aquisalibacillus elongatus TaxID=485577 RepID=A0A3N5BDY2_9BACI|nr:hypothetical protein [Aquisalibacillus elongatus]RPF55637.1 hypothetical protein EDC24_0520 [Aquisalibacillus elongatus]
MYLKNERGSIVIDVLLTISCLIVMLSILLPFITSVMQLNSEREYYLYADEFLNQELKDPNFLEPSNPHSISYKNKPYTLHIQLADQKYLVCLSWSIVNDDEKELCRYVPKY